MNRDRGWSSGARALVLGAVSVLWLTTADVAGALVCGDADDDGVVSVTDGVQTLRAAASLDSVCTLARCDVDGNGTITVTDGVNVLRKAAELSSPDQCRDPESRVEEVVQGVAGIIEIGIAFVPQASATAASSGDCDNVGAGRFEIVEGRTTYTNCIFGTSRLDGSLVTEGSTTGYEDFEFTDLATGNVVRFDGALSSVFGPDRVTLNGELHVFTSLFGDTTFVYRNLESLLEGGIVAGQVLTVLGAAGFEDVKSVELTFDGTSQVGVVVTFPDDTTGRFVLDTTTQRLTPVAALGAPTRRGEGSER